MSERNDELSRLLSRLEEAQAVLEERGSSMADASPLVRALTWLRLQLPAGQGCLPRLLL